MEHLEQVFLVLLNTLHTNADDLMKMATFSETLIENPKYVMDILLAKLIVGHEPRQLQYSRELQSATCTGNFDFSDFNCIGSSGTGSCSGSFSTDCFSSDGSSTKCSGSFSGSNCQQTDSLGLKGTCTGTQSSDCLKNADSCINTFSADCTLSGSYGSGTGQCTATLNADCPTTNVIEDIFESVVETISEVAAPAAASTGTVAAAAVVASPPLPMILPSGAPPGKSKLKSKSYVKIFESCKGGYS